MKKCFLILPCALIFIATAAEAKLSGCFIRTYSKAELGRHPKMQVAVIGFHLNSKIGNPAGDGEILGKFRGEKETVGNSIYCKLAGKLITCQVEGDGGKFSIVETEGGARIDSQEGFSFDDEHPVDGMDERVFHLVKATDSSCK